MIDCRTHGSIPFQFINEKTIIFTARSVPSMGYTIYQLMPDKNFPQAKPAKDEPSYQFENRFYRITIKQTGGIISVRDKELKLELVDEQSKYKLNQYVYENPEGGRRGVANMKQPTKFNRISPTSVVLLPGLNGPVASSLIIKTSAKPCPEIIQQIVLYKDIKRIDIINELRKRKNLSARSTLLRLSFFGKER